MSANRGGLELALEVEADRVSPEQGDVGGQNDHIHEGVIGLDFSAVLAVGDHPEGHLFSAARAECNPAVDVVVCELVGGEHIVVPVGVPFGGGETGECESVAPLGVKGLQNNEFTEPEMEERRGQILTLERVACVRV